MKRKPRTIGIVGTRRRDDIKSFRKCLRRFLSLYKHGDSIVSGGCPKGGDRFAEIIALTITDAGGLCVNETWLLSSKERKEEIELREAPITLHLAEWDKYGKGAGFIRNGLIAEDCDVLIAVVAKDRTGGVEDTIRKAKAIGREVSIVQP